MGNMMMMMMMSVIQQIVAWNQHATTCLFKVLLVLQQHMLGLLCISTATNDTMPHHHGMKG
jgi:hypothetical protein